MTAVVLRLAIISDRQEKVLVLTWVPG